MAFYKIDPHTNAGPGSPPMDIVPPTHMTNPGATCECGHVPMAHHSDGGSHGGCSLCCCDGSTLSDTRRTMNEVPGTVEHSRGEHIAYGPYRGGH